MAETANIARVQEAHAAFKKGEVATILGLLSDSPDWKANAPAGTPLEPLSGVRRSKEEVADYFAQIDQLLAIEHFELEKCLDDGQEVLAVGRTHGRVRESGRPFDDEFFQRITLDDGVIKRVRIWLDIDEALAAFK